MLENQFTSRPAVARIDEAVTSLRLINFASTSAGQRFFERLQIEWGGMTGKYLKSPFALGFAACRHNQPKQMADRPTKGRIGRFRNNLRAFLNPRAPWRCRRLRTVSQL